jgi:N-acetylmuramoyl-L-alanine amidase
MKHLVILDSSFGMNTVGHQSPELEDGRRIKENTFNRSVVRKIDAILEHYQDIDVVILNGEKTEITNEEKRSRANLVINSFERNHGFTGKQVLVSVTTGITNSLLWTNEGGTLIKYFGNPTGFPELMHDSLHHYTQLEDKGLITITNSPLLHLKPSGVICQCAYIDNKKELNLILSDTFKAQCAEGMVDAILKYFEIEKTHPLTIERDLYKAPVVEPPKVDTKVNLEVTPTNTYIMSGDPLLLSMELINSKISRLEYKNAVNGVSERVVASENKINQIYQNDILVIDGKVINNQAANFSKFGSPQGVFVIYNSGLIELKRYKRAEEIVNLADVRLAVGGVSLVNRFDNRFKFNPSLEGYKIGIARDTGEEVDTTGILKSGKKTILGYNKKKNLIYLICKADIAITSENKDDVTLSKLALDYGCDIAIAVGNAGFMINNGNFVFKSDDQDIETGNVLVFK